MLLIPDGEAALVQTNHCPVVRAEQAHLVGGPDRAPDRARTFQPRESLTLHSDFLGSHRPGCGRYGPRLLPVSRDVMERHRRATRCNGRVRCSASGSIENAAIQDRPTRWLACRESRPEPYRPPLIKVGSADWTVATLLRASPRQETSWVLDAWASSPA